VVRRRRPKPGPAGRSIAGGLPTDVRGRYPDTGELVGRPHSGNAVSAFDVVLRPTRASREGDPLLHTHLVVANRVQGRDGRDLYRHRLAADAIYRATYQRQLSRSLGAEWTAADRHGNRELQGIPEDLVRLFSKPSDQIDLEVERLEADGRERTPRLVKWAVQATRQPKQHKAPATLYDRWRTEATME
jgi:conjugative relaxase-like TrwC/TraI family protein